ncbi:MAG: right-handed parallel beta-helix repeat-containing protein [Thermoguttaceae bacterium]
MSNKYYRVSLFSSVAVAFSVFVSAHLLLAETVNVSPSGPISSLKQAVEEVRKLPRGNEPITVQFAPGVYPITEPVVFTPADSGTEKAPVMYQGNGAVITGGRRIEGWKKDKNGVWTTKIPEVADGKWYFEQLFVNNKLATRCREPNDVYFYTEEKVEMLPNPETGVEEDVSRSAFQVTAQDVVALKDISKEQINDVMFKVYQAWETSAHRLASIDFNGAPKSAVVQFTGPAAWPMMNWEPRQRYHIENYKAALNAPGEWFLDRDGTLSYIPLPGEDMSKIEIVAPISDAFLRFEGGKDKDGKEPRVSHLSFNDFKFRHSGYILEPKGHSDGQAAISVPFAVLLSGCDKIVFEGCEFSCIGSNAVRFHDACTNNSFVQNYLHDLGGGGVYIGTGWQNDLDSIAPTEKNSVENCIIRDGGRFDLGSIGIWIGHASYNTIIHNDISEFYYTGISVGWQWGYQPSRSHHNTVRFNKIHNLGHWVMSDMGGVYTLGQSQGTQVSDNVIHDVYAYSYGGWGLYTDEGTTDILMENNLVYNVKTGSFHQHYGRDNTIRNNILAYSLTDQIQRSRVEEHLSFNLENNIILWDEGVLLGTPWSGDGMKHWGDKRVGLRNNTYWNPNADMSKVFPNELDLQTWKEKTGHDEGSIVADPKFKDPKNGDFTLPEDSPAFKTGFKAFDYKKAGVYQPGTPDSTTVVTSSTSTENKKSDWVKLAEDYKHQVRPKAPEKPAPLPLRLLDDFETPRKQAALRAQFNTENRNDLIRVVQEMPASGEKCLEIRDADDLQHAFNPHLVYNPLHFTGKTTISFFLRMQKNAIPFIEWRNSKSPYKIGPTFQIREGTLRINQLEPIPFPINQWVKVEMTAQLGTDSQGFWNLKLRTADNKVIARKISNVHSEWNTLEWFGICNLATTGTDSSIFIDQLSITNE